MGHLDQIGQLGHVPRSDRAGPPSRPDPPSRPPPASTDRQRLLSMRRTPAPSVMARPQAESQLPGPRPTGGLHGTGPVRSRRMPPVQGSWPEERSAGSPGASSAAMAPVGDRPVATPEDRLHRSRGEDHALQQRVGGEPVGAVHPGARHLAACPQAGHGRGTVEVGDAPHRRDGVPRDGRASRSVDGVETGARRAPRRCWGIAAEKTSRPVASSHTWSESVDPASGSGSPSTPRRGAGSSSTKRSPARLRSTAPWPRSASVSRGRGEREWCSAVGWNWKNSRSATAAPARMAAATPSPVASGGLVVTENSCPAPPAASRTWRAATSWVTPSREMHTTPTQRPSRDDEVHARRSPRGSAPRCAGRPAPGPARSRRRSPIPRRARPGRPSGLPRGRAPGSRATSRSNSAPRAISSSTRRGPSSTRTRTASASQSPAPAARVSARCRSTSSGSVGQRGGHTALGPAGGGLLQAALGDDPGAQAVLGSGPHRGGEPGHARTDHEQVQGSRDLPPQSAPPTPPPGATGSPDSRTR